MAYDSPTPRGPELAPWARLPATGDEPAHPPDPGGRGSGGGGGRWIAVAAAVVCLVLAGVAVAWLLTGSAGSDAAASSVATATSGPLRPRSVTATCQAEDGVDSAGNPTTYAPAHVLDGRPETAWRCAGSAVGTQLVLEFDGPVTVTSVGLVPGYAKVDASDGSNRFTQNRTVTAVSWRFDDGTTHVQDIPDPRPFLTVRELTAPVSTTRVVLQIARTGNDAALRDFTAISDVQVSGY